MKKENWPELVALTGIFSVELPGIEPAALPGKMPSDLTVRYVSFRFNTARYLRIPIQVLTASRAVSSGCVRLVSPAGRLPGHLLGASIGAFGPSACISFGPYGHGLPERSCRWVNRRSGKN